MCRARKPTARRRRRAMRAWRSCVISGARIPADAARERRRSVVRTPPRGANTRAPAGNETRALSRGAEPAARGLRRAEQEALADLAAELQEELALRLVLDPFGDHLHAERACEREDRAHDCAGTRIARRARELGDERAVDLERLQRELMQIRERGVAGAEIVERDRDARAAELLQRALHERGVV